MIITLHDGLKKITHKLMKRLSLYLFLILFTLQTPSLSDDIRDFQIEGISLGDSALKHFNANELTILEEGYSSKEFSTATVRSSSFTNYESLQISFKTGDSKYKIVDITGNVDKDYKLCLKELSGIDDELSNMFKDVIKADAKEYPHPVDKSGETKITDIIWQFNSGELILAQCYNWKSEYGRKRDYVDGLKISISTKEFDYFLLHDAWK